jgi:tRNA threonylcarbamoyladenosine biosynthesis protein TsaB
MQVLAIDTALAACSVAVFDTKVGILASHSAPMRRGHAEALLPLIEQVIGESGLAFADLDRIAVTTGPGSFTGLRVGVSAARAIALAAGKPAVGITTLAAFAAPAIIVAQGIPVLAVIDARNNQVYVQTFGEGGGAPEPRIASLAETLELASLGPVRIVGNGAALLASAWPQDRSPPTAIDDGEAPDVQWVARLGATASLDALPKPFYLRAPDARPQTPQLRPQ